MVILRCPRASVVRRVFDDVLDMMARGGLCHSSNKASGFTLVELVAVIVTLGIISVFVVPRFIGDSAFKEYTSRDQIVAVARIAQQRAMHDHSAGACYRLHIEDGVVSAQRLSAGTYINIGPANIKDGVELDHPIDNPTLVRNVYFDGLGNALSNVADCAGTISSTSIPLLSSTLGVCVNASGYIQAQAC